MSGDELFATKLIPTINNEAVAAANNSENYRLINQYASYLDFQSDFVGMENSVSSNYISFEKEPSVATPPLFPLRYANSTAFQVDTGDVTKITIDFLTNISAIRENAGDLNQSIKRKGYCTASIAMMIRMIGNFYLFNLNRGRMLVIIDDLQKSIKAKDKDSFFNKQQIRLEEVKDLFLDKSNPDMTATTATQKLTELLNDLKAVCNLLEENARKLPTKKKDQLDLFPKTKEKIAALKDEAGTMTAANVNIIIKDVSKLIPIIRGLANSGYDDVVNNLTKASVILDRMIKGPIKQRENIQNYYSQSTDVTTLDFRYYKTMTSVVNKIIRKLDPEHRTITPEEAVNIVQTSSDYILQEIITKTKSMATNTNTRVDNDDAFQRRIDLFRRAYAKLSEDDSKASIGTAALNVATLVMSYYMMLNRTLAINSFIYKELADKSPSAITLLLLTQAITGKNIYVAIKWTVLFASHMISPYETREIVLNNYPFAKKVIELIPDSIAVLAALPMAVFSLYSTVSFMITPDDLNSSDTGYIASGMFALTRFAFVNTLVYMALSELKDGVSTARSIFKHPDQKKSDALQLVEWNLLKTLSKFVKNHMDSIPRRFRSLDTGTTIRTLMALNYSGMDSTELIMFTHSQQMFIGFCVVHLLKPYLYKEIVGGYENKKSSLSYSKQMFDVLLVSGPHDFLTRVFSDVLHLAIKNIPDLYRVVTGSKQTMTSGTAEVLNHTKFFETRQAMVNTLSDSLTNKISVASNTAMEIVDRNWVTITTEHVSPVLASLLLKYASVLMTREYGQISYMPILSGLTVSYVPRSLWNGNSDSQVALALPFKLVADYLVMNLDMPELIAVTVASRIANHYRVSNMKLSMAIISGFLLYNCQSVEVVQNLVTNKFTEFQNMISTTTEDLEQTPLKAYTALYGDDQQIEIFDPDYNLSKHYLDVIPQIEATPEPGMIQRAIKKGHKAVAAALEQLPYVNFGNVIKIDSGKEIRMGNYIYNHSRTQQMLEDMHNGAKATDYSQALTPKIKQAGNAAAVHTMMNVVWTVAPESPDEFKNYLKDNIDIFDKKLLPTKISNLFPLQPWSFFDFVSYNQITPVPIEVVPTEINIMTLSEKYARKLFEELVNKNENLDESYFYDFSKYTDSESRLKTPTTAMIFNHPYEAQNDIMRTNYMLTIQIIETMSELHQTKTYKDTNINSLIGIWRGADAIKRESFEDFHIKRLVFCMSELGLDVSWVKTKNLSEESRLALLAMMMVNEPETMLRSYFLTFDEFKAAYNAIPTKGRQMQYCLETVATPSTSRFAGQSVYRYHRYLYATKREIENVNEEISKKEERQQRYIANIARKKELSALTKSIQKFIQTDYGLSLEYATEYKKNSNETIPVDFRQNVIGRFGEYFDNMLKNYTEAKSVITEDTDQSLDIARLTEKKKRLFEYVFIDKNISPASNIKITESTDTHNMVDIILAEQRNKETSEQTEIAVREPDVTIPATIDSIEFDGFRHTYINLKRGNVKQKQVVGIPGERYRVVDIPNSPLSGLYVKIVDAPTTVSSLHILPLPLNPGSTGMYMPVMEVKQLKDLYRREYIKLVNEVQKGNALSSSDTNDKKMFSMDDVFNYTKDEQLLLYKIVHHYSMAINEYVSRSTDQRLHDLFLHVNRALDLNLPFYKITVKGEVEAENEEYHVVYFGNKKTQIEIENDRKHSIAYRYMNVSIDGVCDALDNTVQSEFEDSFALVPSDNEDEAGNKIDDDNKPQQQSSWAMLVGGVFAIGAVCSTALMAAMKKPPQRTIAAPEVEEIIVKIEPANREIALATPFSDEKSKPSIVGKPKPASFVSERVSRSSIFAQKLYDRECEGMLAVRCLYVAANCDTDMIESIFATRGHSLDTLLDPLLVAVVDHANDANMRFIVSRVFSHERVDQISDKQVRDMVTAVFANPSLPPTELSRSWLKNMTDPVAVYARQRRRVFVFDLGDDNMVFDGAVKTHDGIVLTTDNFAYYRLFLFILREYTVRTYHMAENRNIHKKIANIVAKQRPSAQ